MNRFFSFILSFVVFLVSTYELLALILQRYDYSLGFNWFTDAHVLEVVFAIFILSILTLISFGGWAKKEQKLVYAKAQTEYGVTHIAINVFEEIIARVLRNKKQIVSYKLVIKATETAIAVHVTIIPDINQEGSFMELTKVITEEVKEQVGNATSIEVTELSYKFEAAPATKKSGI